MKAGGRLWDMSWGGRWKCTDWTTDCTEGANLRACTASSPLHLYYSNWNCLKNSAAEVVWANPYSPLNSLVLTQLYFSWFQKSPVNIFFLMSLTFTATSAICYHRQDHKCQNVSWKASCKGAGYDKREEREASGSLPGFPYFSGFKGLLDSTFQ